MLMQETRSQLSICLSTTRSLPRLTNDREAGKLGALTMLEGGSV